MEKRAIRLIGWIQAGMNYQEGINLIVEFSDRKSVMHQFAGKENRLKDKLAYELCKAAKVANFATWKDFIKKHDALGSFKKLQKTSKKEQEELKKTEEKEQEKLLSGLTEEENTLKNQQVYEAQNDQYPILIKRIMEDMAHLYQQRSMLHTTMATMDQSNKREVVKQRVHLLDQIKQISERFIFLYLTKQKYLNERILPDERVIYPEKQQEVTEQENLNIEEIKRKKKNLQTSNSKDQKKIERYKKEEQINPLKKTDNARKIILETRIGERIKEIEEIDYKLIKLNLDAGKS